MTDRMLSDASNAGNCNFVNALVKIGARRFRKLTAEELTEVKKIRSSDGTHDIKHDDSEVLLLGDIEIYKHYREKEKYRDYMDVRFIFPTFNVYGRLFSKD